MSRKKAHRTLGINIEYIVLSLILIFALILRLYKISNPVADWHSWRQVDTASVTRSFITYGLNMLYPRYHDISNVQTGHFNPEGFRFVEFPIFNLFHFIGYSFLPGVGFDTWGRLISVIASLLSVGVLYKIGKKAYGRSIGLLGSFFFAFLPYSVYYGRVILPDTLSITFVLFSILMFMFYTERESKLYLILSCLFFSLSVLTKPFTIFYGISLLYLSFKRFGIRGTFTKISHLVAFYIAVVPFLLWRAWMNRGIYLAGIPHMKWAFNGNGIRFRPSFWKWIFAERIGTLVLGVWGLVPFVYSLLVRAKDFFYLSMVLAAFLYVSIIASANVMHDYYQIVILPPICLGLAIGSVRIWESTNLNKFLSKLFLVFSIAMMFLIGLYEVRGYYNINDFAIVTAGRRADELLPSDALVIAPYNGSTAFLYQTKRWGWPVITTSVDELIDLGADYYVSTVRDNDTNQLKAKYKTIEETNEYVIIDLAERID